MSELRSGSFKMEVFKHWILSVEFALVAFLTYLGIDQTSAGILFVLMLIDTMTGSLKSIILGSGFSFKTMTKGVASKLSVLIVPFTVALLAKGLSLDFSVFVLLVINTILVGEAFSILTNVLSIKKRQNIKNFDFVTLLIQTVRNALWKMFETLIKKIENFKI